MKLKSKLVFLACLLISNLAFAKENKYKLADIPKNLLSNAKAIVRTESRVFEISSPKKAIEKVTYAITVLNNNGIEDAQFIEFYNKFSSVKVNSAKVFDKNGDLIKKIKSSDILDYSAISGYSLFEDSRVVYIDPECRTLPFTVEYSYEITYNGILNYPTWYANKDFNIAVEKSDFTVIAPKDYKFRYLEKNTNNPCEKVTHEENTSYKWSVENLKAILQEDYSLHFDKLSPTVFTAPSNFELGGSEGNMESWKNFGKWIYDLNIGKDDLKEDKALEIKELVKDTETDKEKVAILYKYLQNKTRYVSIQVGLGGWQAFDANITDKYSYGDCKALANYMKALLKAVDIKSFYTIIKAGVYDPNFIAEFPSNQFNHVILCVPFPKDTVWLECTSQKLPFGHVGSFTDDREALLITKTGGKLVKTPSYSNKNNLKTSISHVQLGEDSSKADIKICYEGSYYDRMTYYLSLEESERKKFIMKNLNVQNFELLKYDHLEKRSAQAEIDLNLSLSIRQYTSLLGDRVMVPLNLLSKIRSVPSQTYERKSDIKIQRSEQLVDTVVYDIPEQYGIRYIPEDKIIDSKYGKYQIKLIKSDRQVIYIRKLILNKGIYPAEEFDDFTSFFEDIETADNLKFILLKI
ncbi:DUF3857 domain-containing protein [Labilibaculum sp.]|uniref:DUF3857 domain-containing protein n=1 Tax=Labilibaculum sp. TaxID=2060723 RepID=UPI0035621115